MAGPRTTPTTCTWWSRASTTVETALGLACVLLVLGVALAALMAGAAQVAAQQCAGAAVRAAARGEPATQAVTWPGAQVSVGRSGQMVEVEVVIPNPLRNGRATARALYEEDITP